MIYVAGGATQSLEGDLLTQVGSTDGFKRLSRSRFRDPFDNPRKLGMHMTQTISVAELCIPG